ncbi:Fe(2+)-trafficking protein [Candidatus Photodesmus katoptron]|uniref:Probable Fe(2+)-trafficking protein n=1 Tax=Candidatus Photodesmus katoptron Akat1 TaxID=1236703 RepID=S3DJD7_9GAMM|nr:oxidative damage protection protein [Candidatus Photodesmus katoptron]EPE37254.1 bacterial Fe(+) trafficking protein [Candidatus Photodesmus katoptron Akat1]KEY90089.1 Fe(2+)-trafficking protein [Candidatus Photodesmus katoptron]
MGRIIYCIRLKKNAEGMDFQLYPGELGKRIFENISKEAWSLWKNKQTMIINEKQLNTMNLKHLKLLESEMVDFLFKGKNISIKDIQSIKNQ